MYVKTTPRRGRQSTFTVNDDEVTSGRLQYRGSLTGEQVMTDLGLELSSTVLRFLADEDHPTFLEPEGEGPGCGWDLSYVYWWDWEKGFLRLIVSDSTMWILGDNGKTIDRV